MARVASIKTLRNPPHSYEGTASIVHSSHLPLFLSPLLQQQYSHRENAPFPGNHHFPGKLLSAEFRSGWKFQGAEMRERGQSNKQLEGARKIEAVVAAGDFPGKQTEKEREESEGKWKVWKKEKRKESSREDRRVVAMEKGVSARSESPEENRVTILRHKRRENQFSCFCLFSLLSVKRTFNPSFLLLPLHTQLRCTLSFTYAAFYFILFYYFRVLFLLKKIKYYT